MKEIEKESDPYMKEQLMDLYNPMGQGGMVQAEAFFENAEDIINEEEYEESIIVDQPTARGGESTKKDPLM
jgi:hypothetical protein